MRASIVAAVLLTGCGGGERTAGPQKRAQDSPRVVLDRSIGDVRLNMARTEVERRYGIPARVTVFRHYFPVGTRYNGRELVRVLYQAHDGVLRVEHVDGKAKTIETTSSYYRTASHVGVGATLPRDRCARLEESGGIGPRGCKSTWRGFSFDGDCLDAWVGQTSARTMTILYVHVGRRIERLQVGDRDVILPCF